MVSTTMADLSMEIAYDEVGSPVIRSFVNYHEETHNIDVDKKDNIT